MKTRGIRTFGALFVVLLFLMGAWATRPEWSAQAQQGKPIQGSIADADSVDVVPAATVTLMNVHSLVNTTATTGGGKGKLYKFTDITPGYYSIKVTASGYFNNGTTQPFRYDGSTLIQRDFNLKKWPNRNTTVDVLVTETSHASHNETVYIPRTAVQSEETIATYASSPSRVTLANTPVVRIHSLYFGNSNPGEPVSRTLLPNEYRLTNQWTGRVEILNTTIANATATKGPPYSLKATYTYSATKGHLNHTPVAEVPYTVFKNNSVWDASSGDWSVDINLGTLTINRNFVWGLDRISMAWNSTTKISGARVTIYDPINKQVIDGRDSNAQGWANFSVWNGSWEIWASKANYETIVKQQIISSSGSVRIQMPFGIYVDGSVSDMIKGYLFDEHPVAYLYNIDPSTPPARKVLKAEVDRATFTFKAYPGQFLLVVDADWHEASVARVDVGAQGFTVGTKFLDIAVEEKVDTAMIFKRDNWSKLDIYRNLTFNRDSQIPWLDLPYIRDAFLQIDYTLGNRDGNLDSNEITLFQQRMQENGTVYINTDKLLTTNGYIYLSDEIADSSRADTDLAISANIDPARNQPIWINASVHYTVKGTTEIPYNKSQYYVNFTGAWDTNTTVYRNNTYTIDLPYRYEMTETTFKSPGLRMENFTRINLDPGTGTGTPRADMVVRLSANGTARVRVKGPAGHFQELNTTLENYTVVVMASFNITYSADQSYDPVGKISDANFTWVFEPSKGAAGRKYGMDVEYNFTTGMRFDNCLLTIREAGGNITTRQFHVIVDDTKPIAHIWTNRSAGGTGAYADGTTLRVNETMIIRFDATRSTDKTYSTYEGDVAEAHWDFNGDDLEDGVQPPGLITNRSYDTPGNYTLNMWVIDSVGHRSDNVTMKLIINDTTPPSVDFVVYDSATSTTPTTQVTEGIQYWFNATKTTDNYDSLANLTFSWDWGDGSDMTNATGRDGGYNVTHTYEVFNNSYRIKLNVSDTGFLQKTPNYYILDKSQTVQVANTKRPSISIKIGSFSADPGDPEEGQDVKITVTVVNSDTNGRASNIGVSLSVRSGSTFSQVEISPKFYNYSIEVNNSLEPGAEKQIEFIWKADVPGARVLKVTVTDPEEPYTWYSDNSIEGTVNVREAGWKMPLIVFAFIFIIFGIPILWWVFKKFRAGELKLPRREKTEEEPEKKEKKRI